MNLSDHEFNRENKHLLQQLSKHYKTQKELLSKMRQHYTESNKTYFSRHNVRQNVTLNIGVLSMGLAYLSPWLIKCAIKIFFGGSGHYGCYCGPGNSMKNGEPADIFDSVCKVHDVCYGTTATINNCRLKTGASYKWVDTEGRVGYCYIVHLTLQFYALIFEHFVN